MHSRLRLNVNNVHGFRQPLTATGGRGSMPGVADQVLTISSSAARPRNAPCASAAARSTSIRASSGAA